MRHIEGVSPVVVGYISVVLFDAEQPPTQHGVLYVEALHKVQIQEHAETGGEGVVIVQVDVVEGQVVQLEVG